MKLFVTGVSGLLGLNIALELGRRYQVSGGYYSHPIALSRGNAVKLNLVSYDEIAKTLEKQQPDVVIHTAGLTNVEACETSPELAHQLNVVAAANTAKAAMSVGAQLIHISTDHLFDGNSPWRSEEDNPCPINVYAATKLAAEREVIRLCPQALVIRTNFFGWGNGVRTSFSDWLVGALTRAEPLTMFSDVWFSPILINDLIDLTMKLYDRGATGIYHIAGGERLSKHDFALKLAEVFRLPSAGISSISVEHFPFKAARPRDMSLSSQKAESFLGISMPLIQEGLYRLRTLREEGRDAKLVGAIQRAAVRAPVLPLE